MLTAERDGAQTRLAAVETERARRVAAVEARSTLLARLRNELESTEASVRVAEERAQHLANQAAELNEREVRLSEELQTASAELARLDTDCARRGGSATPAAGDSPHLRGNAGRGARRANGRRTTATRPPRSSASARRTSSNASSASWSTPVSSRSTCRVDPNGCTSCACS